MEKKLFSTDCEYGVLGSELSSMKVGGEIYRVCRPKTLSAFAEAIAQLCKNKEKYIVLGNGSNVIFSDGGYDGTVVLTTELRGISSTKTGYVAEAGVMLSALSYQAAREGFCGLEFAYGIPGTVGGGVYMNAGAYGGEMKDVVCRVICCDTEGALTELTGEEAQFSYRHSVFTEKRLYILAAEVELTYGKKEEIFAKMEENMSKRKEKQPLEYPSCGSTFKRPEGHFAGALIEKSGLRGYTLGGAMVSEKHCGFIINSGTATATDVIKLINLVKETVLEKTGVLLETEVEIY